MATKYHRQNMWQAQEDERLAELVISYTRQGRSIKEACQHFVREVKGRRSLSASMTRWSMTLQKTYKKEFEEALAATNYEIKKIPVEAEITREKAIELLLGAIIQDDNTNRLKQQIEEQKERIAYLESELEKIRIENDGVLRAMQKMQEELEEFKSMKVNVEKTSNKPRQYTVDRSGVVEFVSA
jgi:chromosome segregation ATPase